MDQLIIKGPAKLSGQVKISAAKNACLPIMCGILLSDKKVELKNLPLLRDVVTTNKLLEMQGVKVEKKGDYFLYDPSTIQTQEATYDLVKTMRASILVLGPLLSRFKKAKVSLPGGCAIGARPIDIHLDGLEKMGANIKIEAGYVEATTEGLKGAEIMLSFPSVGATENLMMAAVLAEGETIIDNAAREPEIIDLADFLNAMGAKVYDAGESRIRIEGVKSLKEVSYSVIGDRIEAATYIMAALATNSEIEVSNFNPRHLDAVFTVLESMGAKFKKTENSVRVLASPSLASCNVETAPYPGYPTDAQAQLLALSLLSEGTSLITEKIFENRFMHVPELQRMGAQINMKGNTAITEGASTLTGAHVMCTDLRASAALIIAALVAKGETVIRRIYHLDRGYDRLLEKLQNLGVEVKRVNPDN